jgi:hypothetical protein
MPRRVGMRPTAFPRSRDDPRLVKTEPQRDPGNYEIRNSQVRPPVAGQIKTQFISVKYVWKPITSRREPKVGTQHVNSWPCGDFVRNLNRISVAYFAWPQRTDALQFCSRCFSDEMRKRCSQKVTLLRQRERLLSNIVISRHETCSDGRVHEHSKRM